MTPDAPHWSELRYADELRSRGWVVFHQGRSALVYRELYNDQVREIRISGEPLVGTPAFVIYLPSESEWRATYPDWASSRREEVVARIKSVMQEPTYSYYP